MDGLQSHKSLLIFEAAVSRCINVVIIPPNCTDILQPLDVGVFLGVKTAYKQWLRKFELSQGTRPDLADFLAVYPSIRAENITARAVTKAFASCGIFNNKFAIQNVLNKLPVPRTPSPQPAAIFGGPKSPSNSQEREQMFSALKSRLVSSEDRQIFRKLIKDSRQQAANSVLNANMSQFSISRQQKNRRGAMTVVSLNSTAASMVRLRQEKESRRPRPSQAPPIAPEPATDSPDTQSNDPLALESQSVLSELQQESQAPADFFFQSQAPDPNLYSSNQWSDDEMDLL